MEKKRGRRVGERERWGMHSPRISLSFFEVFLFTFADKEYLALGKDGRDLYSCGRKFIAVVSISPSV